MKRSAAYVVLISLSGILLAVPSSVPGRTGGGLASLPRILVPVLPEREARLFAHNLDLDLTAVNCTVNANVIDIERTLRVMIHVYLIADDGAWEMYISLFFLCFSLFFCFDDLNSVTYTFRSCRACFRMKMHAQPEIACDLLFTQHLRAGSRVPTDVPAAPRPVGARCAWRTGCSAAVGCHTGSAASSAGGGRWSPGRSRPRRSTGGPLRVKSLALSISGG